MSRRAASWSLVLAAVLGFGWYKSYENRMDDKRHAAWHERVQRLRAESKPEFGRLVSWLRSLHGQPGSLREVVDGLPGEDSLTFRGKGERHITSWTHPKYGIRLDMEFMGDQLVSHRASGGNITSAAMHPQPQRISTSSRAEAVRELVTEWGGWLWVACLLGAVVSRSHGLVAAEWMLGLTFACGIAWAVSPHYTITLRGIFSNDPLFFAAGMYLMSLSLLAYRVGSLLDGLERPGRFQFGLRTLLALTGFVAVLTAMGPVGYFAISVLAVGCFYVAALLAIPLRTQAAAGSK